MAFWPNLFQFLLVKHKTPVMILEENQDRIHPELHKIALFIGELVVHVEGDHALLICELGDLVEERDKGLYRLLA